MVHLKRIFHVLLLAVFVVPAFFLVIQNSQVVQFDTVLLPEIPLRVGTLAVASFIGGGVLGFLVALALLLAARVELNDLRVRLKKTNTELHQLKLGESKR